MVAQGPIQIMFAIPGLDRGGPDRVLFEVLTKLDRRRFAPSLLVSTRAGHYFSKLPADIPVTVVDGRYPAIPALRHVRRAEPRVVFATQRMILTLGFVSPAFPRATRVVMRQANDVSADWGALVEKSPIKHRLSRGLLFSSLKRADAVVCQSEAMRRDLQTLLGERAHLHVIANPVDVEAVGRAAQANQVTLPGAPALVSVGRLAAQKGYDLLLPAIAEVRTRHPQLHLTIFGDGPDHAALEAQAASLGLASHVTFAGQTAEPPLPAVRAADLFVLASRYEGFPNAALEALACGTPVVLTDCPGANADIVLPGSNGRLAAPGQVAEAIEAALADRYDRDAIRRTTRERYSAPQIVGAYEQLFAEVAA